MGCAHGKPLQDFTPPEQVPVTPPENITTVRVSLSLADIHLALPPKQNAEEVDEQDVDTPDAWVKRHKDMVRLTGRHPFNSEPPMKSLQKAGWITPASLQFVRNHGAVPKLDWATHRLKCRGLPGGDVEIGMDDLSSGKYGPVVSFPVTFICSGNRRKEQNMTKKVLGFNWGPSAVANCVWTGVRLVDVLATLGVQKVSRQHRHLHFDGPEGEVTQGSGEYGCSIDMGWALDRERDILLAFKQNDEFLLPDHGAPLRLLLPGATGAHMVKWLSYMRVADKPTENYYHWHDNRVFPPHVDKELADAEGWWYKPIGIINHININSAIFEPRQNSFFQPNSAESMKVCGYAYMGGGLNISRVDISLDGGMSWEMADLSQPEEAISEARGTDKSWCWSHWETEIAAERLEDCTEICCRAMDSNLNTQPANLTWNFMGMMNNCLFRVKVHRLPDGKGFWFEHPTMPGNERGGWMTEDAGKFDAATATECAPGKSGLPPNRRPQAIWDKMVRSSTDADKKLPTTAGKMVESTEAWLKGGITMEEVEKHNNQDSSWIVVKGRVYDCTPYLHEHPGGYASILMNAGADSTDDFEAVHSKKAWDMLEDYFIGPLAKQKHGNLQLTNPARNFSKKAFSRQASGRSTASQASHVSLPAWIRMVSGEVTFLDPKKFLTFPLVDKLIVNYNTRIFRFGLPDANMRLGLPTGQHVLLRAKIGGKTIMRAYTPITDDSARGHVDFIVKIYFKNQQIQFPQGGMMSQHLESMEIGDMIEVRGPLGDFEYTGDGNFTWRGKGLRCKEISMIAGGTGISLPYQTAHRILSDPRDTTKVKMLYANSTPDDILGKELVDSLVELRPDRFQVCYTVSRIPDDSVGKWPHAVGRVSAELIQKSLFPASAETICLFCGPPAMFEQACVPNLLKLGYSKDNIFES